jgi:hypothetical protein
MEDLGIEEIKQIVTFYKQRASDLELSNLQWQLKYNKLLLNNSQPVTATKVTAERKTKSE